MRDVGVVGVIQSLSATAHSLRVTYKSRWASQTVLARLSMMTWRRMSRFCAFVGHRRRRLAGVRATMYS
ncbi:hypothetical protein B0H19DRAFT_1178376 [Mycena capillaripes]|nr:hypothetical protein B0H19DRAFT_1178376 [Mycena capillaripes]